VSKMRSSRAARASTSASLQPGAAVLTQVTSCPAAPRDAMAAAGKFSSARKRMSGCGWVHLFRAQQIARIGEASHDVLMAKIRVVVLYLPLGPPVGEQPDDELDRKPRATHDGLAGEHVRIEHDAEMGRRHGSAYRSVGIA